MIPLWAPDDLVEATGGSFTTPFQATGVSIDTRTLRPGDLFVALLGEGRDGHEFVAGALENGAAGAMTHRTIPGIGPLLCVDDTLAALARLGAFARARFTGQVLAVTGSVGKTTTKEMLRTILSVLGPTHAAVASYNNHWGLPLTLARMAPDMAFCVAEIGMNHAGEIAPLARLTRPHVAIITTIDKAHIGFLGSIEAIADEKAAILAGLEPDGVAVLPLDSPQFPRLHAHAARTHGAKLRIVTFGNGAEADCRLLAADGDANGSDVSADISGRKIRFRLNAPGRHMAMNAMAALGAIVALGLDPDVAASVLENFVPLTGRGARRTVILPEGSALLLDESYNGNGASMRAALEVLRLQPARRRIAVLGDMLELGEAGPNEHMTLAAYAAAAADIVHVCGPLMRHLYDALPASVRGQHFPDAEALAPFLSALVAPGDAILVKGSLGSRMKQVVDALDALTPSQAGAA
jgi:UDP-N-acetylmuramoyl-tripeptide--D-alanyl-D-alanine ligase